ncbi:MAG: glycerol-3-phosphate 1-O-acyltransferase PlsY [Gammaproteobacteria bacterium]|nr:glycerol-3-phosphate 1-O-acyltransferase PlsY [Gammaproteobacteria bacterium]
MLALGLKILLAYLLGSLNGGLVLGKLLGGPDIRTAGSGSAGGTNALRVRGRWFALGVMVIDIGKGYLSAAWLPGLDLGVGTPGISVAWLSVGCAVAAVAGHCWPVWFGFAGGKGAATALGTLAALAPVLLLPGLVVWLLVVTTTGFVGLSTMMAALALPLFVLFGGVAVGPELFWFLVLMAMFIVYTHRANIVRMLQRRENRMTSLMLLRRPH